MSDMHIEKIIKQIPHHFNADEAASVSGVVQLNFSGKQASDWVITIRDQTCEVEEGSIKDPDLIIKTNAEDGKNCSPVILMRCVHTCWGR